MKTTDPDLLIVAIIFSVGLFFIKIALGQWAWNNWIAPRHGWSRLSYYDAFMLGAVIGLLST